MPDTTAALRTWMMLAAGLTWLYETEQPKRAIMEDRGLDHLIGDPIMYTDEDREYRFVPGYNERRTTVVLQVAHPGELRTIVTRRPWRRAWRSQVPRRWGVHRRLTFDNPLAPGELQALANAITFLGYDVAELNNGKPGQSWGEVILARPAHPTLRAAVNRYLAGCPGHTDGTRTTRPGNISCPCGWYTAGRRLIVEPDWTTMPTSSRPGTAWPAKDNLLPTAERTAICGGHVAELPQEESSHAS